MDDYQRTYLFTVRQSRGSPWTVDCWYDATEDLALGNIERSAGGLRTAGDKAVRALEYMRLRCSYNCDMEGPLSVKTQFDLAATDLEQYINGLEDSKRKDFFRAARLKT